MSSSLKQEARRAARAVDRQRQQQQQQRLSSYTSYSHTPSADTEQGPNALGLGYPATTTSSSGLGHGSRARDASVARSEAFSLFSDGGLRSPVLGTGGAPYSPLPLPSHAYPSSSYPIPHHSHQGARPNLGARGSSYVSNASSSFPFHAGTGRSRGGSTAPSVIEGSDTGGELTEGDEESAGGEREEGDALAHEPRLEDWRDGGADGTHAGGSDSEEGDDVEYTLKDRQDVRCSSLSSPLPRTDGDPFIFRPSTSSIRSVFLSGSPLSTRRIAPSLVTPTPLSTRPRPPPLFITFAPPTSSGPSFSDPYSSSSAHSSARSCG